MLGNCLANHLGNCKVFLRQITVGCKHNSVRLDKWLEILVVEDLTLKERQHELQRQQRRRPVHSSSSLYKAREWISNGHRTECSPIRSVIIRVINKIGRPLSGSPICLTTSMITDRIGRDDVLLPILIITLTKFVI